MNERTCWKELCTRQYTIIASPVSIFSALQYSPSLHAGTHLLAISRNIKILYFDITFITFQLHRMSSKSNSKGPSEEQFVPERTAHAEEITPEEQRQMSGHEKAKQKPSQSFSSVRDKVFRQPDEYIPRVNEDQDVVTSGQTASSSSNLFSGVTSIFQGAAGLGSTAFGAFIGGICK